MAKIQYRWQFRPEENRAPNYKGMFKTIFVGVILLYFMLVLVAYGLFYM